MKIGMLTSGGDCQSLNAAMRGVAKLCIIIQRMWKYTDFLMVIKE